MAALIELPTFKDKRGNLTVIEKIIPFKIRRVYYIYNVNERERGGHRHKKTIQALICLKGSCQVDCNNGFIKENFLLDSPSKCLVVNPEDYHIMKNFTKDAILLVLASEYFEESDYIDEPYD
jgi:dTDP-4-dehydrorhamnose 3,5-epimerase-like enzyme